MDNKSIKNKKDEYKIYNKKHKIKLFHYKAFITGYYLS